MFWITIIILLLIKHTNSKFYPERGRDEFKLYPPCVEINLYCSVGEKLHTEGVNDIDECFAMSKKTLNCRWISFYFYGIPNICYLHSGCAWPTKYEGYAIAPLNCPLKHVQHLGCYEYDVNFDGFDIGESHFIEDFIQCQLGCLQDDQCEAWTYSKATRYV